MRRIIKIQTAEQIKEKIKYSRYGKSMTRVKNRSNPLKIQLIAISQILQRQKPAKRTPTNWRNKTRLFSLVVSFFLFFICLPPFTLMYQLYHKIYCFATYTIKNAFCRGKKLHLIPFHYSLLPVTSKSPKI